MRLCDCVAHMYWEWKSLAKSILKVFLCLTAVVRIIFICFALIRDLEHIRRKKIDWRKLWQREDKIGMRQAVHILAAGRQAEIWSYEVEETKKEKRDIYISVFDEGLDLNRWFCVFLASGYIVYRNSMWYRWGPGWFVKLLSLSLIETVLFHV